uniref:Uncharacterized protein n=1 Tax=Oryza meridionalis TaxID=40149 RepID=A0A0E0E7I7_9ORYZ
MASEEEPGGGDVVRVGVVCVDFWCNEFGMRVRDRVVGWFRVHQGDLRIRERSELVRG